MSGSHSENDDKSANGDNPGNADELTPEERGAREERMFQLSEELQASFEAGNTHANSVWALRFDLDESEVANVRRGLELLFFDDEDVELPSMDGLVDALAPPELPDDYELRGELGRGGMGIVYRVRQVSLDRELALKVLRPGEVQARRAIDRFKREARSLARLRHPHIASLHEVGECAGRVYFTMDLIEGQSLATLLKEGAVTPSRASRWTRQLASALQYVHSHGLVHRDIKPANILIDEEDNACLVDFGLARDVEVSSDLTMSGHFLGTPAYMAPEQVRGQTRAVGESADIYSLGVVLYECLTGKRAFPGTTLVEVIHAVAEGEVAAPSATDGKIPTSLELICMQAMNREASERYPTARALLEDLERFEAGRMVLARPPSSLHRAKDFWQRNLPSMRVAVATAIAMVVVFGLLALGPLGGLRSERGLLEEAGRLSADGQSALAVSLFDRYYPEKPEGTALTKTGLLYCDALLSLCNAANESADDRERETRARQVLNLAERVGTRLRRESRFGDHALLALETEWSFRAFRAAAFLKDEALASSTGNNWEAKRRRHAGAPGSVQQVGAAWEHSQSKERVIAELLIPDLLDATRSHHDKAVDVWTAALRVGYGGGWTGAGVLELLEDHRAAIPGILLALLTAPRDAEVAKEMEVLASLQHSSARTWNDAVGLCDREQLLKVFVKTLPSDWTSAESMPRRNRLCRAILELPAVVPSREDTLDLLHLAAPDLYSPATDLERRVEYLAKLVLKDENLDVEPIVAWAKDITGKRLPRTSLRRADGTSDHEDFAQRLRDHFANFPGTFDLEHDVDAQRPLTGYDGEVRRSKRRQWHERLKFELPEGSFPPIFPHHEPAETANRWHALLDPESMQTAHPVSLAVLRFEFGETEPRLLETMRFDAVPGEPWEIVKTVKTPDIVHEPGTGLRGILGLESNEETGRLVLAGELNWARGGLRLGWKRPLRVPGSSAEVHGSFASRRTGIPGSAEVAVHLNFPRDRGGPSLAEEYVLLQLESPGVESSSRDAANWWNASGAAREGLLVDWFAANGPLQRKQVASRAEFGSLDGDIRLAALRIAHNHGDSLSTEESRKLIGLEERQSKRKTKGRVLWVVIFVFAFVVVGGFVAGIVHLSTRKERSKRAAMIAGATQDEYAAMAPSLLMTTLMVAWWPGQMPFSWFWMRMALYSLLAWNACRYSRSEWKWAPCVAGALAAVGFLLVDWFGNAVVTDPSAYAIPFLLYVLGLFALPVVFNEYWSWHPDPKKGTRLRKIANNIFLSGFIIPICVIGIMDLEVTQLMRLSWGTAGFAGFLLSFIIFLGLEVWLVCLMIATRQRSAEIIKQGMNRRKALLREQKAGAS